VWCVLQLKDDFRVHLGEGPKARRAKTLVTIQAHGRLHDGAAVSRVLLGPITGRRHQLRVHLAHVGHPIGAWCEREGWAHVPDACHITMHPDSTQESVLNI
jgi:hypothetical protein